jgi:hypothetical protein
MRWDTLKHAYPWKTIECDTPKGVTVMCFHPIPKITFEIRVSKRTQVKFESILGFAKFKFKNAKCI